jgi:hypothetical protein
MNTTPLPEDRLSGADISAIHAALFEQLVSGHGQMVLTFLGKIPDPNGDILPEPDLVAAKIFIDQLEMLQVKTRGNLGPKESALLAETLRVTQEAFAELFDAQNSAMD